MRPSCEHCDTTLAPDSLDARICTFECTFCAGCTDELLQGVCPNCSGELLPRPARPGSDHAGVALRRYASCWLAGDLTGVIGCYAEDFTLHYSGRSRFAGVYRGRDAALAVMAEVSTIAARELCSIDEILVGREGGALLVTESLSRDGETVRVERLFRYRVETGLLAECWLYETDQSLIDHLWR